MKVQQATGFKKVLNPVSKLKNWFNNKKFYAKIFF
jgi:hypothetical protein